MRVWSSLFIISTCWRRPSWWSLLETCSLDSSGKPESISRFIHMATAPNRRCSTSSFSVPHGASHCSAWLLLFFFWLFKFANCKKCDELLNSLVTADFSLTFFKWASIVQKRSVNLNSGYMIVACGVLPMTNVSCLRTSFLVFQATSLKRLKHFTLGFTQKTNRDLYFMWFYFTAIL